LAVHSREVQRRRRLLRPSLRLEALPCRSFSGAARHEGPSRPIRR
jgi:hypothetical protein